MFRQILRGLPTRCRCFSTKKSEPATVNFFDKDVAFESEYYYRQDRELLKILKEKTEEEVRAMQKKVVAMGERIEEYNRDINENLRFLRGLENDLSDGTEKKS